MNRFLIVITCILVACSTSTPPNSPSPPSSMDILSFHHGYLEQERLKIFGNTCNLDQFIAGMRASSAGEESPYTDEVIAAAITQLDQELSHKQKKENLETSERFLKKIATDPEVAQIHPQKLYYKVLKKGNGASIAETGMIDAFYQVLTMEASGRELQLFCQETSPVAISLADTIPGFAQGVKGMQVGERRRIFIHPELAYGDVADKLEPNQLLIIELEVTSCGLSSSQSENVRDQRPPK